MNDLLMETQDDELDHFLYDTSSTRLDELSELEKYMGTPLLKHCGGHFDILIWWKDHKREHPILSQITRDVLAVQVRLHLLQGQLCNFRQGKISAKCFLPSLYVFFELFRLKETCGQSLSLPKKEKETCGQS
jgi:hypothetical protein